MIMLVREKAAKNERGRLKKEPERNSSAHKLVTSCFDILKILFSCNFPFADIYPTYIVEIRSFCLFVCMDVYLLHIYNKI